MSMVGRIVAGLVLTTATASNARTQQLAQHVATKDTREASTMIRPVTVTLDGVTLRQAIHAVAKSADVRVQYQAELVDAVTRRVNLAAKKVPLRAALSRVLAGTPLEAVTSGENLITIRLSDAGVTGVELQGTIVGKVVHAKTKQPVVGATVLVGAESRGVQTAADGSFRISLAPGEHVVRVQMIGFVRSAQTVAVKEGETITLEVALEPSASVLDEVVVTGTVVATERRAIPTPITVITAEEIERRGITRIEQFFRGEVPGVVALERGMSRYSNTISSSLSGTAIGGLEKSQVYVRGASSLEGVANPLKTFVDGVEILDANYLGTIDPQSIERIEIITGPQAATLYGSGAMGGVMQIFTKRGSDNGTPDLSLSIKYGILQSNLSSGLTPSHEHIVNVQGGAGTALTYSAGISHTYSGQWTPKVYTRRYGVSAGATHLRGRMTLSGSVSFSQGRNGTASSPVSTSLSEQGEFALNIKRPPSQLINGSRSQTAAINVDIRQSAFVQHHLTIGTNRSKFALNPVRPLFFRPYDTLLTTARSDGERNSLSYNSTLSYPRSGIFTSTLTLGVSASWADQVAIRACLTSLDASEYRDCSFGRGVNRSINSDSWGGFGSWRIGVLDNLYFTAGLRAEKNPNYGAAHKIDWTPTNGVTYVIERGMYTVKFLASYGRATRAPLPDRKMEQYGYSYTFEPNRIPIQLANPDLTPEYSRGPQGGVEVYVGGRATVTVNTYSQTVTDLMQQVVVDTISRRNIQTGEEILTPIRQWRNVASIRQRGWEVTSVINLAILNLKGTYSWMDSRVLSVNEEGRIDCGGYVCSGKLFPGMSFAQIPSHTGNLTANLAYGKSAITLVANFIGANNQAFGAGGLTADWYNSRIRTYTRRSVSTASMPWSQPGYVKLDLSASHQVNPQLRVTANIHNLGNRFDSELGSFGNPSLGRQTLIGLSLRYPPKR